MSDLLQLFGNWLTWIVLAGGLAVAELLTFDFVLIMLAGGALAGGVAAAATGSAAISLVVASVVAVGMLAVVRPYAKRHLTRGPAVRMGTDALVGRQAVVLEQIDSEGGRVRIDGEEWSARALDPSITIEPGVNVDIAEIDGATAVVFDTDKPLGSG